MSCPCALVLSIPLAFFSGIGAGSKKGILFKGGLSIEGLSHLGAVVMDKTGTITEGNFQLQKVVTTGEYNEEQLLAVRRLRTELHSPNCKQYRSCRKRARNKP